MDLTLNIGPKIEVTYKDNAVYSIPELNDLQDRFELKLDEEAEEAEAEAEAELEAFEAERGELELNFEEREKFAIKEQQEAILVRDYDKVQRLMRSLNIDINPDAKMIFVYTPFEFNQIPGPESPSEFNEMILTLKSGSDIVLDHLDVDVYEGQIVDTEDDQSYISYIYELGVDLYFFVLHDQDESSLGQDTTLALLFTTVS